jgi:transcriptional regulator with XRE-family HTH domain
VTRPQTLTGPQGFSSIPELGVVAGHLLKLIRGSLACTQADLADHLLVDGSTVQGWESGRRPLSALRSVELVRLGRSLSALGAPLTAVSLLPLAVEADEFLSTCIAAGGSILPESLNPLGQSVHRRDFVAFVTWPLTGVAPSAVRSLPAPKARGPVSHRPSLTATQLSQFFDQMQVSAESASEQAKLIKRQATYLLGFDTRAGSSEWLRRQHHRTAVRSIDARDVPAGIVSRSASLALARHGDLEPVRHFIQGTLSESEQLMGALTYWAYWLGEIPETYASDEMMVTQAADLWAGRRLMVHLLGHLHDPKNAEMNIHSLVGLVMARRGLLESDSALRRRTIDSVEQADTQTLGRHAKAELANLRFAAQLAGR